MTKPSVISSSRNGDVSYAKLVRIAANVVILGLAVTLLINITSIPGVRYWPDQGYTLLVSALAGGMSIFGLISAIKTSDVGWGENLTGSLGKIDRLRLLAFAAAWVGFATLLSITGFLIAATGAMVISALAIARTRWFTTLPICLAVAALILICFQKVLYVGLPLGALDRFIIETLLGG
jgi:hypothetical protein